MVTDFQASQNLTEPKGNAPTEKFLENRKLVTHQGNMVLEIDELAKAYKADLQPFHFWNTRFFSSDESYIRLNISVSWICNMAVYGRRNNGVSITQYDFVEFIKDGRLNSKIKRPKRSPQTEADDLRPFPHYMDRGPIESPRLRKRSPTGSPSVATVSILHLLEAGNWFFSVYNDDLATHEVTLTIEKVNDISRYCPNECSGRGSCYLGRCDCIDGYTGADCSKSKYNLSM